MPFRKQEIKHDKWRKRKEKQRPPCRPYNVMQAFDCKEHNAYKKQYSSQAANPLRVLKNNFYYNPQYNPRYGNKNKTQQ